MHFSTLFKFLCLGTFALVMTGCATKTPYDYSAFKQSRPRSILVLPPVNATPDLRASNSMLAQATRPLAESGYYVMPVTLVAEAFKENGMTQASDMHATPIPKLREIFGADAALYISISKYGTSYQVISSASVVTASAKLVDLRSGQEIWAGSATASSAEGENQQGGLAALLVTAIIKQVMGSVLEQSHQVAGIAAARLLSAGGPSGILYGPRSPNYQKE